MIKEKEMVVRLPQDIKQKLKDEGAKLGLSLSAYVRFILIEKLNSVCNG